MDAIDAPIEILYQSAQMVVCVKPAGMLSERGGQETLISCLEKKLGGTIYPVHRLDRETGGVMVCARTQNMAAELSRQIQTGQVKKEYLAAVQGVPSPKSGVMEDLLFHDVRKNKTYVVSRERKGVKPARLSYAVLEERAGETLVQVRLFTGRTHQIRAQFSSRGVPLTGDRRYGGSGGALALWAVRLTLRMPDGTIREFSRLPETLGGFSDFPELRTMD